MEIKSASYFLNLAATDYYLNDLTEEEYETLVETFDWQQAS